MKLFGFTLRRPWVKYETIELDTEQQLFRAIMNAVRSDIVADIISLDLCDVECDVIDYLQRSARP